MRTLEAWETSASGPYVEIHPRTGATVTLTATAAAGSIAVRAEWRSDGGVQVVSRILDGHAAAITIASNSTWRKNERAEPIANASMNFSRRGTARLP
jgi:hypothetical protein